MMNAGMSINFICGFLVMRIVLLFSHLLASISCIQINSLFFCLNHSTGETWFALNEMKTTRKVLSLAAHRKKEKGNRSGTTASNPSIWASRFFLDLMHLVDLDLDLGACFVFLPPALWWAGFGGFLRVPCLVRDIVCQYLRVNRMQSIEVYLSYVG